MKDQPRYVQSKPFLYNEDIASVNEVMRSLHLEEGSYVKTFEERISEYYSKKYTAATINGFAAIHLSLIAMGIGKGDEVIMPAYTCPALLYPVKLTGARAVLADIAPNSFNLSVDTIEAVMNKKTRCIIWPHMFGFPALMDRIGKLKKMVIEDVAQAMGGSLNGKKLGSLTDIAVSSFYATKNTTAGDGGAVSVNSRRLFDRVTEYRYYGGKLKLGTGQYYNYKMTNLNAGLGTSQLGNIGRLMEERARIAGWYDDFFSKYSGNLHIDFENKAQSCYHRYPVLFPSGKLRDRFREELRKNGVNCGYGVLEGLHKIRGVINNNSLKRTDSFLKRILCIPLYPGLNKKDADIITQRFGKAYKKIM